jgi:hypothetical protein
LLNSRSVFQFSDTNLPRGSTYMKTCNYTLVSTSLHSGVVYSTPYISSYLRPIFNSEVPALQPAVHQHICNLLLTIVSYLLCVHQISTLRTSYPAGRTQ